MNKTKLVEFDSNDPIEFKDLEEILEEINRLGLDSDLDNEHIGSEQSLISEFRLNRAMTKLTVMFESIESKYAMLELGRVSCLSYNFLISNPDVRKVALSRECEMAPKVGKIQPEVKITTTRPRFIGTDEDDECVGQFMTILNKLTEANYEKMAVQVSNLPITSERLLQRIVDCFFKKITNETKFVPLYVSLCKSMWLMKVPSSSDQTQFKHFRHLFLLKCQSEFDKSPLKDPAYLELVEGILMRSSTIRS